jgi:hypothetical protein
MTRDQQEAKRRAVIERLRKIQQQTGRTPTELERRTAAEAIGCLDHLPDPQDELPFGGRRVV